VLKVSVIIPTYNRADTLPRAIDSVLSQTIEDIEIIIVDDGSTDETAAVVEGYDDPRIRFFQHEQNRNGAAARNTGIVAANGKYIAFLDSDDEWLEKKLEQQLDRLRAKPNDFVGVYCETDNDRAGLQRLLYKLVKALFPSFEKRHVTEKNSELTRLIHLCQSPVGGTSTLLVKHDAVMKIGGFDPSFPRHQDLEFLIRLLKQGKLAVVRKPLIVRHSTGFPDLDVMETAKKRYFSKFQEEIIELESNDIPVVGSHRLELARWHYQRGQLRRGTQYLRRSRAPNPAEYLRVLWSIGIGVKQRVLNVVDKVKSY
jgi:glycosyltransferase involved in cell wall biosynthesis